MSSTCRPVSGSTVPMAIEDGINGNNVSDNRFWYVKAGLRERWHPLGHTVLYGEYKDF